MALEHLLVNGLLPEIYKLKTDQQAIEELLNSYVNLYIEEEIRKEALVRNIGTFSHFFKLSCLESGRIVNLTALASQIGISHQTISQYYRILENCLLVHKIYPITKKEAGVKRLSKLPKWMIFDLGVRRVAAGESFAPSIREKSFLFEQFVGLELLKYLQESKTGDRLRFFRSHHGPEVDFVLEKNTEIIPIEVKWTENPSQKDIRHIQYLKGVFDFSKAFVVCRAPRKLCLSNNIMALPWQELLEIFE